MKYDWQLAKGPAARGYLTRCDLARYGCESVVRLDAEVVWRCESCMKKYGALR